MVREQTKRGKLGEAMAVDYFKSLGFSIEARNWRHRKGEIDIIARDGEFLLFVEVKVRKGVGFGFPESFVGRRQVELYHEGATQFLEEVGWSGAIRFDIISIIIKGEEWHFRHFEDAF